jgi:hypothetical protein
MPWLCLAALLSVNPTVRADDAAASDLDWPTNLSLALAEPAAPAAKPETLPPAPRTDAYVGGRGMICNQGMSGMFLNPTSGTLQQGQLTVQWCFLNQDEVYLPNGASTGVDVIGNGLMGAYGITDWLEVGGFGLWVVADPSPFKANGDDETLNVGGPFVRVRLLKDENWVPEVSVGAIYLDGDSSSDLLGRQEIFVAASKGFKIDEDGFFRSFRIHGGVRQIWKHERPSGLGIPANGTVGYFGAEIELPYDIYLVGEIAAKNDIQGPHTPFSMGVQWKPNSLLGISIAAVEPGDAGRLSFWFGIGFNWKF